jgi:hypothetical protein
VDPTRKELYLSTEDFQSLLGCAPAEFEALPKWKKDDKKKKADLF